MNPKIKWNKKNQFIFFFVNIKKMSHMHELLICYEHTHIHTYTILSFDQFSDI